MNVASRPSPTGKTRTCPHCKHHLRFDSEAAKRQVAATSALKVEAMIRHPPVEEPWEYYVTISIRNDRGEEVDRQVVNVGALQGAEKRTFTLSVEVLPPHAPEEVAAAPPPAKADTAAKAPLSKAPPPAVSGGAKAPNAEAPKAPGRPAPPPGGTGIRLPD